MNPMKALHIIITWITLTTLSSAFTGKVSFKDQIQRADAVARIVVVEIAKFEYKNNEESPFTGLAKCRIVTDYTGSLDKVDYLYIPCDYSIDESPSDLYVGQDYIICLKLLNHGSIAHPVSHDAMHEIHNRKMIEPESDDPEVLFPLEEIETRVRGLLKKKAEQAAPSNR